MRTRWWNGSTPSSRPSPLGRGARNRPQTGLCKDGTAPDGYLHCGPNGAGHFVKMVHNGIEYGMMASIAEGLSIIKHANAGKGSQVADAETTPLRDPEAYQYDIDVGEVAKVWRRGSVVGSWLVDLTANAFASSPDLDDFAGRVSDSGEGRWTVLVAVDEGVPAPVITASLYERFESRDSVSSPTRSCLPCAANSAATPRRRISPRRGRRRWRRQARSTRSTQFPRATSTVDTNSGGNRPCSTTPGVAPSLDAKSAGSSNDPR